MKHRLRIAIEVAGVLILVTGLLLYARAVWRDDSFALNWVKDEGLQSRARYGRLYACEGGYALSYETGLTLEKQTAYRTLQHESVPHGGMALHVPPNRFAYGSGAPVFVLGSRVSAARYYDASLPRWAVPALGAIVMSLALLPRGTGIIRRRHTLRKPGFPVVLQNTPRI